MKQLSTNIILFLLAFVLVIACERANPLDCMKNTGAIVKEERSLDSIRMIVLEDNVNLVIEQSETQKIEIEAGKNLLKKITTTTQGDTLFIRNNNSCNWVRDYKKEITAHISSSYLNQIEYRGCGDISCKDTITGEEFILDIWEGAGNIDIKVHVTSNHTYFHIGTADVTISGIAGNNYLSSENFGLLDTRNLYARNTYVSSKSSNHTYVFATNELEATIQSIGNIYYAGNPKNITPSISGTGELISLDK